MFVADSPVGAAGGAVVNLVRDEVEDVTFPPANAVTLNSYSVAGINPVMA